MQLLEGERRSKKRLYKETKRNGHQILPHLALVENSIHQPRIQTHTEDTKHTFYLSIPFIDDITNSRIRKALRNLGHNIHIVHKGRRLSDLVSKPILHPPTRNGQCNLTNCLVNSALCFKSKVVYEATCGTCNNSYIGSTKTYLHTRVRQHFQQRNSMIYRHNTVCGGRWQFRVRAMCRSLQDLRWTEALLIKNEKPQLNARDEGASLISFLV
jgi:hypothetical protein